MNNRTELGQVFLVSYGWTTDEPSFVPVWAVYVSQKADAVKIEGQGI